MHKLDTIFDTFRHRMSVCDTSQGVLPAFDRIAEELLKDQAVDFDPTFDYVAETDVTASGVYGGYNSDAMLLAQDLKTFILASKRLNQHKKVLFRKRSNAEAGLPALPDFGEKTERYFPGKLNDSGDQRDSQAELLHGIIGVCTEAGELAEVVFDRLVYGKEPDMVNVREEIGDVLWYLARLVKWAGTSFLAEMKRNIAKLRARHGDQGFNAERDVNRDHDAERKLLEGDAS